MVPHQITDIMYLGPSLKYEKIRSSTLGPIFVTHRINSVTWLTGLLELMGYWNLLAVLISVALHGKNCSTRLVVQKAPSINYCYYRIENNLRYLNKFLLEGRSNLTKENTEIFIAGETLPLMEICRFKQK